MTHPVGKLNSPRLGNGFVLFEPLRQQVDRKLLSTAHRLEAPITDIVWYSVYWRLIMAFPPWRPEQLR